MHVTHSKIKDFVAVAIDGEVDLNSSPQLRKVFTEILSQGASKILINFVKVSYIDSSGLATLIEMMQRLKKENGQMRLVGMSDKVKSLFEITKLDKLFLIYRTEEEALAVA